MPGQKPLAIGLEEAPRRPNQAPEVTVETRLALAQACTVAFGPTVGNGCLKKGPAEIVLPSQLRTATGAYDAVLLCSH